MANILTFDPNLYFTFFLVLLRVSGIFLTAPIISADTIPPSVRIYLALICALIIFHVVPQNLALDRLNTADYLLLVIRELMIGLLLGVVPKIMFASIDFAGTVIGFQMGFSIANVVDPQTEVQVSIIAAFEGVLATLLFVVLDGHHIFFEVLALSYQKVALGGFVFSPNKIDFLSRLMADLFIIGLQLGAPLIVALLFANVILGFMARSIPQMNIFVVGFPFTIGLGLILLWFGMPYTVRAMVQLFGTTGPKILDFLALMAR
ncbi:MAG: flagellar biosynthetic protein FliR [SAR324 cluster bacterium]|uniref:Flagellar biosynthetic protein FliR n=1 Tax=SAR324 cluster bacterium TaxID=2024889 RepID=A0A2A4SPH3_9DELT|nr:MAG: flagellar biosynthetic protein FliR [SAR324 cluster bacterium]